MLLWIWSSGAHLILESPEEVWYPGSRGKISFLLPCFTYSKYEQIEVLFIQDVSGVYTSLSVRYRWTKNGLTGPKSFRGFREAGPWIMNFWKRHVFGGWNTKKIQIGILSWTVVVKVCVDSSNSTIYLRFRRQLLKIIQIFYLLC